MNGNHILIMGAGRIGLLAATLLRKAKYNVFVADNNSLLASHDVVQLNVQDKEACQKWIKAHHITTLISCLPYFLTFAAFEVAQSNQLHYFDLTEDVYLGRKIKNAMHKSTTTAVMPCCGLAPGWSGILAHHLMTRFDQVESSKIRVGGLPQFAHNALHYALTWSVDGLLNEYGNLCEVIERGKRTTVKPLEDVEELEIDGMLYEAFNTSGGAGNLIDLYENKIKNLSYKTIRYPGHAEKMRFLMNDLKLNDDRQTLKNIFENALPSVHQDVVIIDIAVMGKIKGKLQEETIVKKYYPRKVDQQDYSALQLITAASACAVVDIVLQKPQKYQGLCYQETIPLSEIEESLFGKYL